MPTLEEQVEMHLLRAEEMLIEGVQKAVYSSAISLDKAEFLVGAGMLHAKLAEVKLKQIEMARI